MEKTEEEWVRTTLVPELLKNGQLIGQKSDAERLGKSFKLIHISVKFIGNEESFMLTKCFKAKITYEFFGITHECNLVVKKTPNVPEDIYNAVNFSSLFSNEVHSYNNILPTLNKFSKSLTRSLHTLASISSKSFPKFFFADLQELSATIVLSDFSIEGWRMTTKRTNLSLEHVLLAVKYLASFHGTCYALKKSNRSKFDSLVVKLKEARYGQTPSQEWQRICNAGVGRTIKVAKKFNTDIPAEFIDKLQTLIGDVFGYGRNRTVPIEPFANLCHGDYLRNNVAYRYDDVTAPEIPTDVMMFDLQTMRYSSPMVDLTIFLSLSCGADVRSEHFEHIFTSYCNAISYIYTVYLGNEEFPTFLSLESLRAEYIRYLPYSLAIASAFLMTLHDPENISTEDLLKNKRSEEEILDDIHRRGGEVVDKELAFLVRDLFELSKKFNVDIFEGFL